MTADEIIAQLNLAPHPEGGYYRQTWVAENLGPATDHILGPALALDQIPQLIVPAGHWQAARTTGEWTLVGCTVSPGFDFSGFCLAPPNFDIPR